MIHARASLFLAAAVGAALCLSAAYAQDAAPPGGGPSAGTNLPVRQVVLFSSGVGYFERSARLDGPASLRLSFRTEQVNDILKSLVLFDPAGQVKPVTYTTAEPVLRRLGPAGQALNGQASLGAILRQFQGARVRLELAQPVEGRIVSVSLRTIQAKEGQVQQEVLNVLTDGGLRAVPLDEVGQVKLLDAKLDEELRHSLELLATGLDDQKRQVELQFGGGGAREVRAGYLQEMPVWKTSYRLVLGDGKDEGKRSGPYLQGWAIVENTTDEDWKDVRLSLVSGRPVSFIEDLYQPLYVPRPVVQAQLIGSPNPQTYGEAVERTRSMPIITGNVNVGFGMEGVPVSFDFQDTPLRDAITQIFAGTARQYSILPDVPNVPVTVSIRNVTIDQALREVIRAAGVPGLTHSRDGDIDVIRIRPAAPPSDGPAGPPGPPGPPGMLSEELKDLRHRVATSAMAGSVRSEASAQATGALFEYAIRQPISIPRSQAAMVPIVTSDVAGEKLSIFDPATDPSHALNGFLLKNTTGLMLAGGPITVFDGGSYAGDAQILPLQPNEERLLSYAVDLDLVAAQDNPGVDQQTLTVSAKNGVLVIDRKQRMERHYTFRNKGEQAKTVLIQQPVVSDFKLVRPEKPFEKTASEYRFKVTVLAKQETKLAVVEERPVSEEIALLDADVNVLEAWSKNAQVSEKLRGALKELVTRQGRIAAIETHSKEISEEIKSIGEEQARIRQNMVQLDHTNPLYQQYVKKLTEQEGKIERLQAELARLRASQAAEKKELQAFVEGLNVA